jgi:hypothetical protein
MTERTVAVLIALLSPAVARAESTADVARADALFNAAKQLRHAGQYADACPQFAESSRLAPGVGVSLYLGDCYERIGRTASAWTAFRSAEKLALERNDQRADVAHARAQALEPKLSGLTILVPAAVAPAGTEVLLDGSQLIPPQQWNVAMAVDPGDHVVTVNLPSQTPRTLTAHVAPGSRTATVRIDDVGPAPTPSEAAPPAVTAAPAGAGATRRWVGIGLLGAGAVGIGLGTVFILNKNQPASSAASCAPPPNDTAATTASTIAFVAGGIALVAGLGLSISAPAPKGVGVVATPVLLAGGGGALLRGSF